MRDASAVGCCPSKIADPSRSTYFFLPKLSKATLSLKDQIIAAFCFAGVPFPSEMRLPIFFADIHKEIQELNAIRYQIEHVYSAEENVL